MKPTLEGSYDPQTVERSHYARWESEGLFRPEITPNGEPWCLVIPPPNVTGVLHMGHALEQVMMDSITRAKRMQGRRALYLPGADHAGIATQNMVEADLRREGKTRHDLGREAFVARTWEWKERYHDRIRGQIRRMGASCDWSRERFTMDPTLSTAVRQVFVAFYERGLAYRGTRIINWCVRCRTALSDLEVEFHEQTDQLYRIHYPLADGSEGLTVATVRPETMFGDVAVAVNPTDERFAHLVGKSVILPLVDRPIPVIADDYVTAKFGTGALKITPAHDPNDYEVGQRHGLPKPNVITIDGRLTGVPERFEGMPVADARAVVVRELTALGLLRATDDYTHKVGSCQRCGTVAEPLISTQWFVKMEPLAQKAIAAIERGDTRFVPERWTKVFLDWMLNIRDWCISRQLWWGHRIPAWYCEPCGETIVSVDDPTGCPKCGGAVTQDDDVLDTWFSSGLWPFSTLGWPAATADFAAFYPTTLLITGYDIIFFWVARMMTMALELTGKVPFATVAIHGLVRDDKGQKMSKTKGNVIDPMEVIERHGVDPLRFGLASLTTQGQDFALTDDRFQSARFFINKVWNATKFALHYTPDDFVLGEVATLELQPTDRWILTRAADVTDEVTRLLDDVELAPTTKALYAFTWGELCDWYLEFAKLDLNGDDPERKAAVLQVLHAVLGDVLKLLHPIIPFATEEMWRALPGRDGSIMVAPWPTGHGVRAGRDEMAQVETMLEVIRAIRSLRSDLELSPRTKATISLRAPVDQLDALRAVDATLKRLGNLERVDYLTTDGPKVSEALYATFGQIEVYLAITSPDQLANEIAKLEKNRDRLEATRVKLTSKLDNPKFIAKAAPEIIEKDRAAHSETLDSLGRTEERLRRLRGDLG